MNDLDWLLIISLGLLQMWIRVVINCQSRSSYHSSRLVTALGRKVWHAYGIWHTKFIMRFMTLVFHAAITSYTAQRSQTGLFLSPSASAVPFLLVLHPASNSPHSLGQVSERPSKRAHSLYIFRVSRAGSGTASQGGDLMETCTWEILILLITLSKRSTNSIFA
jgi:hypothetical protein